MNVSLRNRKQSVNSDLVDPKQVEERRKALKAIGKFGLYTPPMLLAFLESGRAHASPSPVR